MAANQFRGHRCAEAEWAAEVAAAEGTVRLYVNTPRFDHPPSGIDGHFSSHPAKEGCRVRAGGGSLVAVREPSRFPFPSGGTASPDHFPREMNFQDASLPCRPMASGERLLHLMTWSGEGTVNTRPSCAPGPELACRLRAALRRAEAATGESNGAHNNSQVVLKPSPDTYRT